MSERDDVQQKIVEATAAVMQVDPNTLTADKRFEQDLGAKSVHLVQIIAALEDEYDVEVSFMKFRRAATIGQSADFVAELL